MSHRSTKIFAETPRLIIREILESDAAGMFEMDSDPEVHRYLSDPMVKDIRQSSEIIEKIRQSYGSDGIGRWALEKKASGEFIGWTGLKLCRGPVNGHTNYIDLGYRLLRRFWGKGFATESALPSLAYGFEKMKLDKIFAEAEVAHAASNKVLQKCGMKFIQVFDDEGYDVNWYELRREEWQKAQPVDSRNYQLF